MPAVVNSNAYKSAGGSMGDSSRYCDAAVSAIKDGGACRHGGLRQPQQLRRLMAGYELAPAAITQGLNYPQIYPRICVVPLETTVEKSGLQIITQSAVTIMSPQDSQHLHALLRNFDAERLGEGNVVAGANVLAAMAVSLANVQRPGSGFVARDGATITVGTSLLVSGSESCSLIDERVLTGLGTRQNHLIARLRQMDRTIAGGIGTTRARQAGGAGVAVDWDELVMQNIFQQDAISDQQASEHWGSLISAPPQMNPGDLRARPMFFIAGIKTAHLTSQLERCHMNHPFLHIGVDSTTDFAHSEHLCPAVIDGRMTAGTSAETIRGTVMVTDPNGVLGEAVRNDLPSARWTSRMCWLIDGHSGPSLDEGADGELQVALSGIGRRYSTALGVALGQRINTRVNEPLMLDHEFSDAQVAWLGFLRRTEPAFIGAGRSLYISLHFGLKCIVDAARAPTELSKAGVMALAKFLIHRMANARAVMLESAEFTRQQQLKISILNKLATGPMSIREITRRFNRLTSGPLRGDASGYGSQGPGGPNWGLVAHSPIRPYHGRKGARAGP